MDSNNQSEMKCLRYGMVGGGKGAFIGDVHRKAAAFDNKSFLVAGCFSRDYQNTLSTGFELGIEKDRLYESYKDMARVEGTRKGKIDFVAIVTPNHMHYAIAKEFLQNGIHVICDKPLTIEMHEAEELAAIAEEKNLLFCVTYCYTGYPMALQAKEMIKHGDIGEIRMVYAEYSCDWLLKLLSGKNNQEIWRLDPSITGKANCLGDIGTHMENMVSYMTGLKIDKLLARMDVIGEGIEMDTNDQILVKFTNGASGMYWCSQITIGCENNLAIRIFGDKGSIEWSQNSPDYLKVSILGQPLQIMSKSNTYLYPSVLERCRIPEGHPEAYYIAFSNIYNSFANALFRRKEGLPDQTIKEFPDTDDGIQSVRFVSKCVESSENNSAWVSF